MRQDVYLYNENITRVGRDWTNETYIPDGETFEGEIYITDDNDFVFYEVKIKDLY